MQHPPPLPLDLLLVTGAFPLRSQSFIGRKAAGLAARGHRVTVLASAHGDHELDLDVARYDVEWAPPGRSRAGLAAASSAAVRHPGLVAATARGGGRWWGRLAVGAPLAGRRPDLVHVEWVTKAADRMEALEALGCPIVVSCRGSDVAVMARDDRHVAAELGDVFDRVDAVHCVSAAVLETAVALGLDREKAFVNHPGVDTGWLTPVGDALATAGTVRIVSVGRLHPVKGYDLGLAALRLLVDRGHDVRWTIVGGGDEAATGDVVDAAAGLDVADRVELTGPLPPSGVREVLGRSHVLVLPSLSEGLSNAVLEAMAMALPVVVSDVGGMAEAVRDGVDGRLVPAADPVALADALEPLVVDPALRAAMGARGRRRVCESFTLDRQIDCFVDHYRGLVARPGAPRQ